MECFNNSLGFLRPRPLPQRENQARQIRSLRETGLAAGSIQIKRKRFLVVCATIWAEPRLYSARH